MNESKISKVSERRLLKLRDACSRIYSGGTPDTSIKEYWTGNFPWLSSGETNNRFIKNTKKLISESGVKNSSTKLAKRRSSVIASAGQGHTRGQVSYLMIDTYINQSVIALFPDETILDSLFLFYSLNLKYEHFRQMSDDHSIRGSLTTKMLGDEEISLPPLADQKVIAKILSDLDEKIELNNEMNKTLEEIAQAIFKSWFIDFEFPNENGDPYKSSGGEMVESELGMIPKGWRITSIKNFGDVICGKTPSTKVKENFGLDIPFITIPDMHGNTFVIKTERLLSHIGMNSQRNKLIPPFSICVSCIATPGLVSITSEYSQTNQQINSIVCHQGDHVYFVYLNMKNKSHKIRKMGLGGSATLNLNTTDFGNIKMVLPDDGRISAFNCLVEPLFLKILTNSKTNLNLAIARDLLLPKLMTGKIRVPMED